ncbi:ABC transporter permease [Candidatus Saccharibacteria bacterium]|nr:ABC transporter permease [Candidatus Saccharibacteria bacterium]
MVEPKALMQGKRKRRKALTMWRMSRYGMSNFTRNMWLTVAATAVMTITLLIIFITLVARQVLVDTVDTIKSRVDMSVYVKTDTPGEQASLIRERLEKLPGVNSVRYIAPGEARDDFAKDNSDDMQTLDALNEAVNKFPGTFRVNIADINDPSQLDNFVKTDALYKKYADPDRKPSFSGQRRTAIQNIGKVIEFAQNAGLVASVVFIAISSLVIFNTIRMAIFNRREEIEMMKLIGADKSFIRGPFVVEAVIYGLIAAIIATGVGVGGLYAMHDKLADYQIAIDGTIHLVTVYIWLVLPAMMVAGALIGVVSSLLATRKYLKI